MPQSHHQLEILPHLFHLDTVVAQLRRKALHRHPHPAHLVEAPVHHPHPALPELPLHHVTVQNLLARLPPPCRVRPPVVPDALRRAERLRPRQFPLAPRRPFRPHFRPRGLLAPQRRQLAERLLRFVSVHASCHTFFRSPPPSQNAATCPTRIISDAGFPWRVLGLRGLWGWG